MDEPYKLNLSQWAPEDRPREKMMLQGARALTNAELLAILIHTGNTEDSVVALTQKVMASCRNSLSELGKLSVEELCSFKGIGPAKAITILAACELGRRRKEENPVERPVIRNSRDVYDYFYPQLADLQIEECHVLFVNQAAKVLDSSRICVGGIAEASVDIRCVLRDAIMKRAVAIALCHNHPSGSTRPSTADDELTRKLYKAAGSVDIRLIDHIVFADKGYYSYADEGRL
ncbi:MAG: DNA repair protein RadC [Bacteroidaceae bacterium]|nr:DNA repair protein RadC [Bacteroidaceae bacterium]